MKTLKTFEDFKKWSKKIEPKPSEIQEEPAFPWKQKENKTKKQLQSLVGKTIIGIEENEDEGTFRFLYDGGQMTFYMGTQGEAGWIEDIENEEDLYSIIQTIEYEPGVFLKIKTQKGYVVIEFRGPYGYEVELDFVDDKSSGGYVSVQKRSGN